MTGIPDELPRTPVTGLPWLNRVSDWIDGQVKWIMVLAIAIQLSVLGFMIITNLIPHLSGTTIKVRVVPVDPRDLFRGDYVILSYEFSRIPPKASGVSRDTRGVRPGQTVYVSLVPAEDGQHWQAQAYSNRRPDSGVFLKGTTRGWNRADFGIESYFVQEGEGKKYEDAIRNERLSAELVVDRDGKAALKRLVVD